MNKLAGPVAAGLCVSVAASAQSPLIIDRNRADRVQPVTPTPPEDQQELPHAALAPVIERGADREAILIHSIRFVGSRAPEPAARAAEPFLGQPATRATLQAIAAAISDGYARSNVALYSVLIPNQDIADGVLRVVLIEGEVEAVAITDASTGHARRRVAAIARHLVGETPLRRSTLQRYLSVIQDLPGTRTDIDIVRGSAGGLVRVVLTVRDRPNQFAAGFDNRSGSSYRGGEFTAKATVYHLLRGGDQTDVDLGASVDFRNYRFASLSHSTALDDEGGRLTASFGYLETHPRRSPVTGNAQILGLSYSRPLIRDYRRNLTLSLGIDGLNADNAAFGQLIARERTRAVRLAAGYIQVSPRRTLSAGLTFSQGLDIAGARVTAPLAETKFAKLNARVGIDQAIGKALIGRLRLNGQYSRNRLPAAERFAVGGSDYGRAFEVAAISADRGAAGSLELAFRPLAKSKDFAASELYGFIDGATLRILPRGTLPGGHFDLASAGAGIRLAYRSKASLFVEAAKPIDRPYAGYRSRWRFWVGWKLSLRS